MESKEKYQILTKYFEKRGIKAQNNKTLIYYSIERYDEPIIYIWVGFFMYNDKYRNMKWDIKIEIWLMEHLTPFLNKWGDKKIYFSQPTYFKDVSTWYRNENNEWERSNKILKIKLQ